MARKKQPLDTAKPKHQLDLGQTLAAFDLKNVNYMEQLPEEQRKAWTPYVFLRFASSAPDQQGLHSYFLQAVNDLINVDFWPVSKYPDFMWKLFCLVGLGKKTYHSWIAAPKKSSNLNKLQEFLHMAYPGVNDLEIQILLKQLSVQEFKDLCMDYALEDAEIKPLMQAFENAKDK